MGPKAEKIADIQALRGVAILLVLCYHLSLPTVFLNLTGLAITSPFHLGVELFFVISGYVVMLSLIRSDFNIRKFAIQRLFRLYPAIIVFLVLSGVINLFMRHHLKNPDLVNLFTTDWHTYFLEAFGILTGTLNNVSYNPGFSNGAMWSLSVEMQFYFYLGLVCLIHTRVLRLNSVDVLRFMAVGLTAFYLVLLYYRLCVGIPAIRIGTTPAVITRLIAWKFDFLVIGVVLAISNHFADFRIVSSKRIITALFYSCLIIPIIFCAYCESPLASKTTHLTAFGYPLANLCFLIAIAIAAMNLGFKGVGKKGYQFLTGVGERSYTIYLLHFPIFIIGWYALQQLAPNRAFSSDLSYGFYQLIVFLIITIPVVELVYRYLEIPWIERGKLFTKKYQQTRNQNLEEKLVTDSA
jgi:peptidoglycan/LPS O-acetylase OafA/YrhL